MYLLFNDAPLLGWLIDTNILILAIAIGVFLAFFAFWFTQTVIGSLVRRLLSDGVGEENAKTLKEISKDNFIYRFFLRDGSVLRKTVSCVGGEIPVVDNGAADKYSSPDNDQENGGEVPLNRESDAETAAEAENVARIIESKEEKKGFFAKFRKPKRDFEAAKFYIEEENAEKAKAKYPKKVSAKWLILVFVLCTGIGIAMLWLLPFIMDLILK